MPIREKLIEFTAEAVHVIYSPKFVRVYQFAKSQELSKVRALRMLEYMLQSRESSWRFPSTLQTILDLLLINLKKILSKAIKNEINCFDFGSIKRELRPHLRTIIAS